MRETIQRTGPLCQKCKPMAWHSDQEVHTRDEAPSAPADISALAVLPHHKLEAAKKRAGRCDFSGSRRRGA